MLENAMKIDRAESARERGTRSGANAQGLALAMAYVPMQCLKNAYSLEEALAAGTLFPELDKPFTAERGGYGNER